VTYLSALGISHNEALYKSTVTVKAKFHYTSWFGASSEPASVMEFGCYRSRELFSAAKSFVRVEVWSGSDAVKNSFVLQLWTDVDHLSRPLQSLLLLDDHLSIVLQVVQRPLVTRLCTNDVTATTSYIGGRRKKRTAGSRHCSLRVTRGVATGVYRYIYPPKTSP